MFIGNQGALLAGASPIAMARAPETKDGDLTMEVKTAVDQLAKTFEDFKVKNDERLKQVETKRGEDAVTKDEVEKLNKATQPARPRLLASLASWLARRTSARKTWPNTSPTWPTTFGATR